MRNKEFSDRRGNAASAKAATLEAFRAAQIAAAPEKAARLAERVSVAEAREQRREQRDRTKLEEQQRLADEAAASEAAKRAAEVSEVVLRKANLDERIARVVADEATRKSERDLRYAKRKAAAAA
ncbi:DUF6481 family protein [Gemmobacter sp. 24YEA27]|uniref:DUF6481 family protein n=1 Tax=Gemmobacter sp. 24YEA27 TaxID=3040672 RepID=UPI0024B32CD5|nr:DUF6481 family protein [Gemmobacter sp. 24YEA27]